MTADMSTGLKASRYRVPRSRGAISGTLLVLLGAWAAIVPFIGPYLNIGFTPAPNSAWQWTAGRGWLEVLPGAAVFLGGLLMLISESRLMAMFAGWLAAAGGAWLIVGPSLASTIRIHFGQPDPASRTSVQALEWLVYFYAIGAAIIFVASVALGRLSVRSMRDVAAARRRLAEEEAAQETVGGAPGYPREPAMAGMGRRGDREEAGGEQAVQPGQQGYEAGQPGYDAGQQGYGAGRPGYQGHQAGQPDYEAGQRGSQIGQPGYPAAQPGYQDGPRHHPAAPPPPAEPAPGERPPGSAPPAT
jgi:hypothetical protein